MKLFHIVINIKLKELEDSRLSVYHHWYFSRHGAHPSLST